MGLTFRKSFTVIPHLLKYNVNARSRSWTLRVGPFSRTWSSTGRRTTSVNLPGPAGYRRTTTRRRND
jgi:hypothetical protein